MISEMKIHSNNTVERKKARKKEIIINFQNIYVVGSQMEIKRGLIHNQCCVVRTFRENINSNDGKENKKS